MELKEKINKLVNFLPTYYPELNLQNHCYRRIAYDSVMEEKWDKVVKKPFVNNVNDYKLMCVITFLSDFIRSKYYLLEMNKKSIENRKCYDNKD